MKVKGSHKLNAGVEVIWSMLQDEKVLARIAPGVSRIEKIADDKYKAISDISIGPVRGSFEGDLSIEDQIHHESMTLVLSQKSKIGNAEAKIVMHLSPEDDQVTAISYDGSAKVSGRLATMGQRILGGVISTLSKQVFKELEIIIEERNKSELPDDHTDNGGDDTPAQDTIESDATITKENSDANKEGLSDNNISRKGEKIITSDKEHRKSIIQIIIDKIKSLWK